MLARLKTKILTLITRVRVDRSDDSSKVPQVQITRFGKAAVHDVMQPQGLYFRAPPEAEGVLLSAGGAASNAVLVSAQDRATWPAGGGIEDGEGGLHYLGAWKVFVDKDGNLNLGTKVGASKISRDDKIQTELKALQSKLDALTTKHNTHVHASSCTAGGSPVQATTSQATAPAAVGATASANVKTT